MKAGRAHAARQAAEAATAAGFAATFRKLKPNKAGEARLWAFMDWWSTLPDDLEQAEALSRIRIRRAAGGITSVVLASHAKSTDVAFGAAALSIPSLAGPAGGTRLGCGLKTVERQPTAKAQAVRLDDHTARVFRLVADKRGATRTELAR
eukprot:SAG31_NODE_20116_length_583_cov_1.074380_1_plen_149_part_10